MTARITFVAMLLFILFPAAIPADDGNQSASRWGITTKKNLEDVRKTAPDGTGSERDPMARPTEGQPSVDSPATSALEEAGTTMVPDKKAAADTGDAVNAGHSKKSATLPAPKKITPQVIHWSSEQQKNRCNGYLKELRSLFLKTRHYSIQGASCNTAVSAAAFLKSMNTCQQNCPEGLLQYSGYTDRIIRNIRYLEKLGNDRCSGFLTPNPPMSKTP